VSSKEYGRFCNWFKWAEVGTMLIKEAALSDHLYERRWWLMEFPDILGSKTCNSHRYRCPRFHPPLGKDSPARDHQRLRHHGGFNMRSLFVKQARPCWGDSTRHVPGLVLSLSTLFLYRVMHAEILKAIVCYLLVSSVKEILTSRIQLLIPWPSGRE